jgi:hypothetical protein
MGRRKSKPPRLKFAAVPIAEVPAARAGKHGRFVADVFNDLAAIDGNTALRIPISELPGSKPQVRSALHRMAHKQSTQIATTSDRHFFYIWVRSKAGSPRTGFSLPR